VGLLERHRGGDPAEQGREGGAVGGIGDPLQRGALAGVALRGPGGALGRQVARVLEEQPHGLEDVRRALGVARLGELVQPRPPAVAQQVALQRGEHLAAVLRGGEALQRALARQLGDHVGHVERPRQLGDRPQLLVGLERLVGQALDERVRLELVALAEALGPRVVQHLARGVHRDHRQEVDAPLLDDELEQPVQQRDRLGRRPALGPQRPQLRGDRLRRRAQDRLPALGHVERGLPQQLRVGLPGGLELVLVGPAAAVEHRLEAAERGAKLARRRLDAQAHRPEPHVRRERRHRLGVVRRVVRPRRLRADGLSHRRAAW
jgi:hypothetical protein